MSDDQSLGRVRGEFDIARAEAQRRVRDLADEFRVAPDSIEELRERGRGAGTPIDLALALELAQSKREVAWLAWSGQLASAKQGPITTWESLLKGGGRWRPAGPALPTTMKRRRPEWTRMRMQPPSRMSSRVFPMRWWGVHDAELGQRAVISPLELRGWLETLRAN